MSAEVTTATKLQHVYDSLPEKIRLYASHFSIGQILLQGERKVLLVALDGTRGTVRPLDSPVEYQVDLKELTHIEQHVGNTAVSPSLQEKDLPRVKKLEPVISAIIMHGPISNRELDELGKAVGMKHRQLRRYVAAYLGAGTLVSLALKKSGRKVGSKVLHAEVLRIVAVEMNAAKSTQTNITLAKIYRQVKKKCDEKGLKAPAMSTLSLYAKSWNLMLSKRRSLGVGVVKDQVARHAGTRSISNVFDEVQIDHTPVDIIILDKTRRYVLGRPWLTLVFDSATRAILGFYLSFYPPSMESVAHALLTSILPKQSLLNMLGLGNLRWDAYGIARKYFTDHGAEFKTDTFKLACENRRIDVELRPLGKKHHGGAIERVIGTIMGDLHLLPGTTFSNAKLRKHYNSEKQATLTFDDLLKVIVTSIVSYMHDKNSSLGITPQQAFLDALPMQNGVAVMPPLVRDPEAFRLEFLPTATAINRAEGIKWREKVYFGDALRELPLGERITFATDRTNTDRVYVHMPDGRRLPVERQTSSTYNNESAETALRHAKSLRAKEPEMLDQLEKAIAAQEEIVSNAVDLKREAARSSDTVDKHSEVPTLAKSVGKLTSSDFLKPAQQWVE